MGCCIQSASHGAPWQGFHQGAPVVRKELRRMTAAEQERFARAVLRMMVNTAGPESSEYYRCASYHGWPHDFCQHGHESFAVWHRAYLLDFERALRGADAQLGGDGQLGLPYWDWQTLDVNGECYPKAMSRFFSAMPPELISTQNRLKDVGYQMLASEARILTSLRAGGLDDMVWGTLEQEQHHMAACTRWRGMNIESPHNSIHVLLGFPMNAVEFAAFHPIFFVHHCNIDRLYQKYLELEPNSAEEMAAYQRRLESRGERNRYEEPLRPFKFKGKDCMARDMFHIEELGYSYDELPRGPPQRMRERPTYAVFWPIEPLEVAKQSMELHVFVVKGAEEADWQAGRHEDFGKSPSYAGWGAVWGSKEGCSSCRERKPMDVRVDVTAALSRQGLRRSEASVRVVCIVADTVVPLPRAIPVPKLEGPYFEGPPSEALQRGSGGGDVVALQAYLAKYHYYAGAPDGVYGESTERAVKDLQAHCGLEASGVVDAATKGAILRPRADVNAHPHGARDERTYAPGQRIRVFVDTPPGHLGAEVPAAECVAAEVGRACDAWAAAAGVSFALVKQRGKADITVSWADRTPDNLFLFDGKGGSLAEAGKDHITLDEAEYWVLQGAAPNPRRQLPFELLPILLHEMGHCLGLVHSECADDVMFPYYVPGRVSLAPGDVRRVQALYAPGQKTVAGRLSVPL